ncbi:uncharacterized protein PITG_18190 [Phytophthora infestans T30-4]|uniref:Uncharacterized protein n=1 Tax=Phytophthora infestans (strain T30-4) TaxID=403677 RepID=D0NX81_PHYIT|nr:uncharacterized protein PITG_18190 [Phytophthora infestans T30-4]EEY67676.1 conserved hypothetical protein [Phytophthora infestans T30-4]|eukprot:XP_002896339.1 conserved hypothetical protein [Phytophthora infestans T30-4]
MARKWFKLVGNDGKALILPDTVAMDIEDVAALCHAVKQTLNDSHLAGVAAANLTVFASQTEYNEKQALESDSPIGSFGGSKKVALIVQAPQRTDFALTTRARYPAFLKKAIEIANLMLKHCGSLEAELGADRTTRANLRDVQVRFKKFDKGSIYGWTERSERAKTIFVNEILQLRVNRIDQANDSHEYQCIVFVVAATIFHECAHLTLRWQGTMDSPPKYHDEVALLDANRKRRPTSPEDPNILIPPLCGISENRNIRRVSTASERIIIAAISTVGAAGVAHNQTKDRKGHIAGRGNEFTRRNSASDNRANNECDNNEAIKDPFSNIPILADTPAPPTSATATAAPITTSPATSIPPTDVCTGHKYASIFSASGCHYDTGNSTTDINKFSRNDSTIDRRSAFDQPVSDHAVSGKSSSDHTNYPDDPCNFDSDDNDSPVRYSDAFGNHFRESCDYCSTY